MGGPGLTRFDKCCDPKSYPPHLLLDLLLLAPAARPHKITLCGRRFSPPKFHFAFPPNITAISCTIWYRTTHPGMYNLVAENPPGF